MRLPDQEIVDRLVVANTKRRNITPLLADYSILAAPLPGEVLAFLRSGQTADAVWAMHSRKCRRNLQLRLGINPQDLWRSMYSCTCYWPEQRLREQQEAQA